MKKIFSLFVILSFSAYYLLAWPVAYAAAIATHSWDECTSALDITATCASGGSGYSGNWTNGLAGFIGRATSCQVANCITTDGVGDNKVYRTFSATASGHGSIYMSRTSGDTNAFRFNFCQSGTTTCEDTGKFYIRVDRPTNGSDVNICTSSCTSLASWTADTQQLIQYQWGTDGTWTTACASGEVTANFNGSSFSSCLTMAAGNDPGTTEFISDDVTGGDNIIWDELNNDDAAAGGGTTTTITPPLWWILRN